jgi:hypothetical protein
LMWGAARDPQCATSQNDRWSNLCCVLQ